MNLLSTYSLLALSLLLTACSGSDAPPTPKVAGAASAAEAAAPAVANSQAATPAPNAIASDAPAAQAPPVTSAVTPAAAAPSPSPEAAPGSAAATSVSTDPSYEVHCPAGATAAEQCQVDKDTYIGWRTFSGQCQVCHGGSALGSTFAPNLLDRFHQHVDHARFIEVVTNGFRGQVGAMPSWKGNPNVIPHIDQLYRYLKARADGVLPAGRPERAPAP